MLSVPSKRFSELQDEFRGPEPYRKKTPLEAALVKGMECGT
jgi:hypothetical protein